MARTVFRICVLMVAVVTFAIATTPQLPWGIPGIITTTTRKPTVASTRGACPQPTEELKACIRQWDCQELLRLDLRCLLNLNGLPLIGNALGGLLGGGGGQSPGQQPALGGPGGGLLGGPGGGLLGGGGGLLGGLLG